MAEIRRTCFRGAEITVVSAGGTSGEPGRQLESVVEACRAVLAEEGLSEVDVALSRLWMRDRESAAGLNDQRERLLRSEFRSASSSFFRVSG
jgi:hypothetical protein